MLANNAPVLLDLTRLIWRRWAKQHLTGIDRVCLAYMEHFAPVAQAVIHHRRFRSIIDREASAALFGILSGPPSGFRQKFLLWGLRYGRKSVSDGRDRLYLNIGHTGLDSEGFLNWVNRVDVKPVYFVHDLIPITHPEFCRAGEYDRHSRRMRTVLASGCGVIGNSQSTLDELERFAQVNGLPRVSAVAAWLGATRFIRARSEARPSASPTFVTIGTIEARKNHLLLLEIWSKLVSQLGPRAPRLLMIGQRGWKAEKVFEILDSGTLRGHVVELNGCGDAELAEHLQSATALLFPSYAEGYGLPLVEALGLGTPVIASDLPVFREIGQGVPDLLPADDEEAWRKTILSFAHPESAARAAQVQRLASFRLQDWKTHFRVVEDWLSRLAATAPANAQHAATGQCNR
jgi:glycosyltransferase involved in cell wall biosynthesis